MKILIIVPTLDSYQILPKLVKSLQSQSYEEWRVLFVDGRSSNSHKKWLQKFCLKNEKFNWIEQRRGKGIFGAMNDGIDYYKKDEWILFWGSDDWCPHHNVFELLVEKFHSHKQKKEQIDLIICKGKYINPDNDKFIRISSLDFSNKNFILNGNKFKKYLQNGFNPPHQGVIFSPQIIEGNYRYDDKFLIAADLDFFLRISKNLHKILVLDFELVHMSNKGVSGRFVFRKFFEVLKAYKRSFGNIFLIIFFKRYIQRIIILLTNKNNAKDY